MKQEDAGDKKPAWARATKDEQKKPNYVGSKPYKSKVNMIEDDVFEVGLTQNATHFTKLLLNMADYIQVKDNN